MTAETRAQFLRRLMREKALGVRELGRLCADVLDPDPDRYEAIADDWKGRVGDYSTDLVDGGSEPRDKALRTLSAALNIAPDDWPPPTQAPNVRQVARRLRELEAAVFVDTPDGAQTVAARLAALEERLDRLQTLVRQGFALLDLTVEDAGESGDARVHRAPRRQRRGGR